MVDTDDELLQELVTESKEHLANIEPDLLLLEKGGAGVDKDLINRVFRAMHSIKGGFSFLGFVRITELSHKMESVLMRVRDGQLQINPRIADDLLKGTDTLQAMLDDVGASEQVDIERDLGNLSLHLEDAGAVPKAPDVPEERLPAEVISDPLPKEPAEEQALSAPNPTPAPPLADAPAALSTVSAKVEPKAEGADTIRVRVDLLNRLMNLAGELVLSRNQIKQAMTSRLFDTASTRSEFKQFMRQLQEDREQVNASLRGVVHDPYAQVQIKDILDREFDKIAQGIRRALNSPLSETPGFSAVMQNVDNVTSELQGEIMNTRMQPVSAVFSKFPRVIRDLARKTGKQIDLIIEGQEVELDKSIIEALADPLTHLIRNCADHGIELPQDRKASGKNPTGTILLRAFHEGGQVNIEVSDDGAGIDGAKIKKKSIEKGLITPADAAQMSNKEALALIFAPGLSTAEKVSDISGRGVGMDVVRTNIVKLGGTIDIDSAPGQGTRMFLRLPLTLAIIPSLIVASSGRRFAVPQVGLVELVRVRPHEIKHKIQEIQGKPVLRIREKLLPLVRLTELLGLPPTFTYPPCEEPSPERRGILDRRGPPEGWREGETEPQEAGRSSLDRRARGRSAINVVVLRSGANQYGLVVEELLDSEEIVVKPLSKYLSNCLCYAGATIMGDGKVAMILDAKGMAETAGFDFEKLQKDVSRALEAAGQLSVLETQPILLFKNYTPETYAINLSMVARVEKRPATDIERIGGKEFIKYEKHSLRVLRLHDFLPVAAPTEEDEWIFVIIPKLVRHPMGIIAGSIEDIIQTDAAIDRCALSGQGILGSTIIKSQMVLFVDIYTLFSNAEPEIYAEKEALTGLSGVRVLLAEDTAFFQAVMVNYLKGFGAKVDLAKDGLEALELLRKNRYDILVTDIQMPRMDGLELTRKVRADQSLQNLPIVAVTSLQESVDRTRGLEAGVDLYSIKLDKEALHRNLVETLNRKGRS